MADAPAPRPHLTPDARTQASAPMQEVGVPGTKLFAGYLSVEDNPALRGAQGLNTFKQMSLHPTCAAMIRTAGLPIASTKHFIAPASDDPDDVYLADFIHHAIWEFGSQSFGDLVKLGVEQPLRYGFQPTEPVYDKQTQGEFAGLVAWDKIAYRDPLTSLRWNVQEVDSAGGGRIRRLVSWTQLAPPHYQAIDVPADKLLLFNFEAYGENFQGTPNALDTPIATPQGWTTVGAIQPGDELYDEAGVVRRVAAKSPVYIGKKCYEVITNSGERIVASDDHKWHARSFLDRKARRGARTVTTEEMFRSQKYGVGVHTADSNWSIPAAAPLQAPEADLPIDPYVLGYWLGNGTHVAPSYGVDDPDSEEIAEQMRHGGYWPRKTTAPFTWTLAGSNRHRSDFVTNLRALGVYGNKHVPSIYLRASAPQRLALLQGLMDSDGSADKNTRMCVFANTNPRLVAAVYELAASLGCRTFSEFEYAPSLAHAVGDYVITGRKVTTAVCFALDFPAFRLTRKAARQRVAQRPRPDHMITAIREVPSVPVQCLMTDGPSHLFLAGKRMVPTHNSALRYAYEPWFYVNLLCRIEAIGLERTYMGIPEAELPEDYTAVEQAAAQSIVNNLRTAENAGVVHSEAIKLAILTNKLEGAAMRAAIDWYDTKIPYSILAHFVKLGHSGTGAYSLSEDQSELFLMMLAGLDNDFCNVINQAPGIPTLLAYNFPNLDPARLPRLEHGEIGQRNMDKVGRLYAALGQWGFLTPDDQTEDHLREQLELPPMDRTITPEALASLTQTVAAPTLPGRSHSAPRIPNPLAKTPVPKPGDTPTDDTPAPNADITNMAELRTKLRTARAQAPWPRARGPEDRVRVEAAYQLAEILQDLRSPQARPDRPSIALAKVRRPYVLHMADKPSAKSVIARVQREAKAGTLQPVANPPTKKVITRPQLTSKKSEKAIRELILSVKERGAKKGGS